MERAGGVRGPTARGSQVLHLSPPRLLSVISARLSIQLLPRLRDSVAPPTGSPTALRTAQPFPSLRRSRFPGGRGRFRRSGTAASPHVGAYVATLTEATRCARRGTRCARASTHVTLYTRYPVHTLPSGECACRPCGCAVALLRLLVSPPVGESATTPRVRRHAEEGGALTLPSERAAGGEGETSCAGSPGGRGAGAWVGAAGGAAALGSPDGGIRRGLSARPRGGRALR